MSEVPTDTPLPSCDYSKHVRRLSLTMHVRADLASDFLICLGFFSGFFSILLLLPRDLVEYDSRAVYRMGTVCDLRPHGVAEAYKSPMYGSFGTAPL